MEKFLSNKVVISSTLVLLFIFIFWQKTATIASVIIGSYITLLVSRVYYLKAGKELEHESSKIRSVLKIMALKQQDPEAYQIKVNNDGNIGATVEMSATIAGSSKLTGNLQVHEKGQDDILKANK